MYTSLCTWDSRQCSDLRGVLISEILNREIPPYYIMQNDYKFSSCYFVHMHVCGTIFLSEFNLLRQSIQCFTCIVTYCLESRYTCSESHTLYNCNHAHEAKLPFAMLLILALLLIIRQMQPNVLTYVVELQAKIQTT